MKKICPSFMDFYRRSLHTWFIYTIRCKDVKKIYYKTLIVLGFVKYIYSLLLFLICLKSFYFEFIRPIVKYVSIISDPLSTSLTLNKLKGSNVGFLTSYLFMQYLIPPLMINHTLLKSWAYFHYQFLAVVRGGRREILFN